MVSVFPLLNLPVIAKRQIPTQVRAVHRTIADKLFSVTANHRSTLAAILTSAPVTNPGKWAL
ncbi:hypothetical protein C7H09_06430 [Marinobacter fuscus]|uniref:Uncharacterized protein n=1 Tax=Marinobacter fuscus TaxID=2109942 RepID=A0A2T1KK94_9GAMM|nr:hypothetical protein C7H09_06430 [Marinobacter fuscus]